MTNLLQNPSFEEGWDDLTGSIQEPHGWTFDYHEGIDTFDGWTTEQPELRVMGRGDLPPEEHDLYITDGDQCVKLFASYKAFSCELVQRVEGLEPGATYRFTITVYVDTYDWDDGKVPPQPNEERWKRAARVCLGSGLSTEQWFDEANVDNWYLNSHTLSIEFQALMNTVPIAVEFWNPWPIDNNGYFLDDFRLEKIGEPEDNNHVGYEVTVHTPAQNVQSYDKVCEIARETLGTVAPSYDDTGRLCDVITPSGRGGRAILYDIPVGEQQDFYDYFAAHYPDAEVEFAWSDNNPFVKWQQYLLTQGDDRWGDYMYADGQCYPLRDEGCWITDCAMAQRIFNIDPDATPVTVDEKLGADGYYQCRMLWSAMEELGLEVLRSTTTEQEVINHLESGGVAFLEVAPSSLMHFVLAVEHTNEDFVVLDPWKGVVTYLDDLYTGWESARLVDKLEPEPSPEPQYPPTPLLAFHAQNNAGGLAYATGELGMVKLVEDIGTAEHMPDDVFILARNWLSKGEIQDYTQMGPEAHFEEQLKPWLDKYPQIDAIEDGMNEETGPHNDGKNEWAAWWAVTTARLVREYTNGQVKTVMLNPGPGAFPLEGEGLRLFEDVFRVAHEHGDYIGIHPYTPAIGELDWINEWYPLRFMQYDAYSREHWGYYPRYIGTEAGPIGGSIEWLNGVAIPHLNAGSGWRHETCLNGNWRAHQDVMRRTLEFVIDWNRQHGNRVRYWCLFTVYASGWSNFQYHEEQIRDVVELAKELT